MAAMNDKGQMLLIGAVVMAVSFIALGIVLNGSFHTETMASEASEDVTGGKGELVEQSIESDVESLVRQVVENNPPADQTTHINNYLQNVDSHYSSYYARSDAIVTIRTVGTGSIPGRHIEHNGGEFVSSGTRTMVVSNGRVRDFTLSSLSFTGSGPFTIHIDESRGSEEWDIVFEDGGATNRIRVDGPGISETCTIGSGKIDLGNASVASGTEACTALAHLDGIEEPYDVVFIGGDQIEGNYELVTESTRSVPTAASSEFRLYGVEVVIELETMDGSTVRQLIIAPGEIHD